ncbi:relaxase/mobilization nuclease domain-containing protein, partial [Aeromonas caviae]|uniref:relaxase/mobilization nuclease domain-containing protein n=1 Tax=Aeromonas caviae TaxID=648 RepID=UPI001CC42E24
TATHGVLVWSKPMCCMKSAATASHFSALRRSPGGRDIGKPVWHCSLSLPPGERLSAEKWEAVAADFMQHMG